MRERKRYEKARVTRVLIVAEESMIDYCKADPRCREGGNPPNPPAFKLRY